MNNLTALDVYLHEKLIGKIINLPDDRNLFAFEQDYIDDSKEILSLSFKDRHGNLMTEQKIVRSRLPPFFSNLLPEGHMRDYLAMQAGVSAQREFHLLAALGQDLPGALKVVPASSATSLLIKEAHLDREISTATTESVLRFSLAGVQLKFSAIWDHDKGLTIPCHGIGGSWIVKLPSPIYAHVAENEYVMLELARAIGINVPKIALIPLDAIKGLPQNVHRSSDLAFATQRFDREPQGHGVHIEDFAQIFAVFPEKKYQAASFRNIAQTINLEIGESGVVEFIRRFVFNALIGNGDMHLKNWSLLYSNRTKAELAPAYDFVSTIPYIPGDSLALTFVDSKKFSSLTYEQFARFANKAGLPTTLVEDIVRETVRDFKKVWPQACALKLPEMIYNTISNHLETIPIYIQ